MTSPDVTSPNISYPELTCPNMAHGLTYHNHA